MIDEFIFEHRYKSHKWRFQIVDLAKGKVLSVWPWFQSATGEWLPGSPKYGGGFQMPLEGTGELGEALIAASERFASSGP